MENVSTEEKFLSAVEIIKNLPKTGSVQTSNETKLKFYSFFKQATQGKCELPKPGFWDLINRAKWDAWNRLGNMSKEEAMQQYVKEFVKIIEDTPMDRLEDPSVLQEFVQMMGPFIVYMPKDCRDKLLVNGKPPLNNNSEDYVASKSLRVHKVKTSDDDADMSPLNGNGIIRGGNESDSDEFSDTLDRVNEDEWNAEVLKGTNIVRFRGGGDAGKGEKGSPSGGLDRGAPPARNPLYTGGANQSVVPGSGHGLIGGAGGSRRNGGESQSNLSSDVGEQLAVAVLRLQHTMEQVVTRLDSLEALLRPRQQQMDISSRNDRRWRVFGIHPSLAFLVLAWPFIVQWIVFVIRKRQRRGAL